MSETALSARSKSAEMPKNIVIALLGGALIDGICGVAGLARPWPAAIGGLVAIVILGILGARR